MDLEGYSFGWGFFLGVLFATLLGMVAERIQRALQGMHAPDRPMVIPTTRTPRSVYAAAARAFRDFVFSLFLMVILIAAGLALLYALFIGNPFDLLI